ncbi:MAG: hypothetical protein LBE21_06185 [Pseudomonadales bacterium]|jgi:hypothetical protein|nr:hypothetical protein [Pseudomonadales bacterium]
MNNSAIHGATILILAATLSACSPPEESAATPPQAPSQTLSEAASGPPRLEDGTVNLGTPPGVTGFWTASNGRLVNDPNNYEAARMANNARVNIADAPLQPWTLALINHRQDTFIASEPYTRCKPSGGPRQIMSPYGFEIVQMPEIERIYILTVSNAMSYRTIYMDGREHPAEILRPTYLGHSIGHWEGDTLVVDTVGFSERTWTNRDGLPTTDQLHLTERFTRSSLDDMDYTVTIDDPGAYTAPWTSGFALRWNGGMEVFEYVCQENNISPAAMVGEGRESLIVP